MSDQFVLVAAIEVDALKGLVKKQQQELAEHEAKNAKQQQQLFDLEARQRVFKGMLLGLCRRWRQTGYRDARDCADQLETVLQEGVAYR